VLLRARQPWARGVKRAQDLLHAPNSPRFRYLLKRGLQSDATFPLSCHVVVSLSLLPSFPLLRWALSSPRVTSGRSPSHTHTLTLTHNNHSLRGKRWTGMLQKELGEDCLVVEQGLNSRTSAFPDPVGPLNSASAVAVSPFCRLAPPSA
jgi:hypothetical protein